MTDTQDRVIMVVIFDDRGIHLTCGAGGSGLGLGRTNNGVVC